MKKPITPFSSITCTARARRVVLLAVAAAFVPSAPAFAQDIRDARPERPQARIQPVYGEVVAEDGRHYKVLFHGVESNHVDGSSRVLPFPENAQFVWMRDGVGERIPFDLIRSFEGKGTRSAPFGVLTLLDGRTVEVTSNTFNFSTLLAMCAEHGTIPKRTCIFAAPIGTIKSEGQVRQNARLLWVHAQRFVLSRDQAELARFERDIGKTQDVAELSNWRSELREGVDTNCGMVLQVREAIVEVQLKSATRWIRRENLFPSATGQKCTI